MISLERSLKFIRIVLYFITAMFLLLQFAWHPFVYFAMASLLFIFVNLAVLEIFKYNEIKKEIKNEYEVFLVKCYNEGKVTKNQLDSQDKIFYPEYVKSFRTDKIKKILFFILWFGLAVSLLIIILNEIF